MYQLDIKNAFLHENLQEVYIFNPSVMRFRGRRTRFVNSKSNIWFEAIFSSIVWKIQYCYTLWIETELLWLLYICKIFICQHNYFYCFCWYIIATVDNHQYIIQLKAYLSFHFHTKDIGLLRYFLGIVVGRCLKGLSLSQKNTLLICWKKLVH